MAVLTNVQCYAIHPFETQANLPSLASSESQLWGVLSVFRQFLAASFPGPWCGNCGSGWNLSCCAPGSAIARRSLNSNPGFFMGLVNWSCNFIFFIIVVSLKGCVATTWESWEDTVTVTTACAHPLFLSLYLTCTSETWNSGNAGLGQICVSADVQNL